MKRIIIFIALLSFILVGCSITPNRKLEDYGLSSITNAKELNKLIKKSEPRRIFNLFPFSFGKNAAVDDAESKYEYQSTDYTKTNVQVEGVDEGDIMKTDGSRIYSISQDRLQVVNLLGEGQMETLLSERLITETMDAEYYYYNTYYSELYVTDNYLIVIGQKYEYCPLYYENDGTDSTKRKPSYYYYTISSFIDIYDKESLEKLDNYDISGRLLGSRLINDNLYLISNYSINHFEDDDYDIRPWYKHNDETEYFDYEDIKYIPESTHRAFTIISTITLNKNEIDIDNDVFISASSWGEIYVSLNSIYFACNYYEESLLGSSKSIGLLVSFQFDEQTGEIFFGGYGNYDGSIINQFAIDEYNGYIRIATTKGWGRNVKNRLYIFKRELVDDVYTLTQISLIDTGIGKPGERIRSVRFNQDIATVVTFLETDPFYTIDLSDPYNPVIAGELEIPGFSTYQHPWTDNLIIGIGFDAENNGRTTGIKIALYDITDINNPIEIGKPLIFDYNSTGYNYSESIYNHKAIMIDKSRNCIGMPITRYIWNNESNIQNEYLILDIDETKEQPIQIKLTITHDDYFKKYNHLFKYKNYWTYNFGIKRAFRVDDYLYIISDEVITSHNLLGDLAVVDEIIFEQAFIKE